MSKPLAHKRVLVTRPAHQSEDFCHALRAAGAQPLCLPCIEIVPHGERQTLQRQLALCDWLIFTSVNAVQALAAHIGRVEQAKVAAIGRATAEALRAEGYTLAVTPQKPYDSETLLTQLRTLNIECQHIGVVKGVGGRNLLSQTLQRMGIACSELCVYERKLPHYPANYLDDLFSQGEPDIVSTTSNEGLSNLLCLLGRERADALRQIPLVVNSARGQAHAQQLGFTQRIYIANPAGDQGQLQALRIWAQSETKKRNE